MKSAKVSKEISTVEYVRIRKYVIDSIIHGERKPRRLASMRELAAQFGVGSTTVQKALKDLVADGYLIPKVGVGMFTNPQRGRADEQPQIVELLTADGKQIYYENYLCCMSSEAAMAVTRAGYFLHHVDLFQDNQGARAGLGEHSRGVIWVAPEHSMASRTQEFFCSLSIPRVVMGGVLDGVDSADYDRETEGYEIARKLLAEQRRHILVLAHLQNSNRQLPGIRRAYREAGLAFDERALLDHHLDILEEFRKYIRKAGVPDAIYDIGGGPVRLWPEFRTGKIDFLEHCRLVMTDDHPSEFPCWMIENDYAGLAANAVALLKNRIASPGLPPVHKLSGRRIRKLNLPN
ncbi:MAG: GntR family transcriptional regulator [Lentisphaeria bacterium]|nr:GntR family transcriptional regulator [Lentisphaeria bacterium]